MSKQECQVRNPKFDIKELWDFKSGSEERLEQTTFIRFRFGERDDITLPRVIVENGRTWELRQVKSRHYTFTHDFYVAPKRGATMDDWHG